MCDKVGFAAALSGDWRAECSRASVEFVTVAPLDLTRPFLPEALAGLASLRGLEGDDRRAMNQIRAASYLHVFDLLETAVAEGARAHAARDVDERDTLVPLLRLDAFDHHELFHGFEQTFERSFPVKPRLLERPSDLDEILSDAVPLALLIFALHLKLVTQQHYLACVRGDESLEPSFVRVLKEHWTMECGRASGGAPPSSARPGASVGKTAAHAIQQALGAALPGRIPAALRDYKRIVFVSDDVLRRQSELDVATLEEVRGAPLSPGERETILAAQVAAHRKTFITFGIVNAAFVYSIGSLGPSAPAMLAGMVSALSAR